jgi:exopolysaccharide/PEP-CTERM locus tyrosine autokinase
VPFDLDKLRAASLLPPLRQEHELTEQFRQIKRPLIASATGRSGTRIANGNLIMLASAEPGEGKTFASINLAVSMAFERDVRVLLVDADVGKPQITRLLGLEAVPGLLDALQHPNLDIESLISDTDIAGLSVLPAGKALEHTTELLASERMREIARTLGERDPNRIVLFDSPPLLHTTQSQALAQALGQIVLIVRFGVTLQQAVLDAIERLGQGKHVSVVLNQSRLSSREGYQYYGQAPARQSLPTS